MITNRWQWHGVAGRVRRRLLAGTLAVGLSISPLTVPSAMASVAEVAASGPIPVTAGGRAATGVPVLPGISSVIGADRRVHAFVIAPNGKLLESTLTTSGWSGMRDLGGRLKGAPAVTVDTAGDRYDVFAVDVNGDVVQRYAIKGVWSSWRVIKAGSFSGNISAARGAGGSYLVLPMGADGRIYQVTYSAGKWSGPTYIGGPVLGTTVMFSAAENRYDMFAVYRDGDLHQKTRVNGTWGSWRKVMSGSFTGGTAVFRDAIGRFNVFVVDPAKKLMRIMTDGTSGMSAEVLNGVVVGKPAATFDAPGAKYDILAVGTDERAHQLRRASGAWQPWRFAFGSRLLTSPPETAQDVAKVLLARWGGRLTGKAGVLSDLQAAAAGKTITNSSSCGRPVRLDLRLLKLLRAATDRYSVLVNNIVTGHSCDGARHPMGMAVDFNRVTDPASGASSTFKSYTSGDSPALNRQFVEFLARNLPSGGGVGQRTCPGQSSASIPAGIQAFADACNHQHAQVTTG